MKPPALEPSILVIFGITGDLAARYLLPALYHLVKDGALGEQTEILGITRGETTADELFEKVELCVNEVDKVCDPVALKAMHDRTSMFQMDLDDPADYDRLLKKLNDIEAAKGVCMHRIYYLSIPPRAYQPVVRLMGDRGLNTGCPHGVGASRLLVEKPFGRDLPSAEELISETGKHFKEDQIFRIDHYLAKDAVEELLTARQADKQLDARWNAEHIASIDIIAKEQIGIEGRASFYDPLGALRDFIQSHLIQVLGIVTMEAPATADSDHVHAAKEAALAQIEPVPKAKLTESVVRGQYAGYRDEVNNSKSTTETFVAVTVRSQAERWQDVPFKMLTGKALDERRTEVVVNWRGKPAEHISMRGHTQAYERVLADAVRGDHTIFSTKEEILTSWRILQPVVETWQQNTDDLVIYEPGTEGPKT